MNNKTPQIEVGEEYTAPSFIEFAAIQIFAAMVAQYGSNEPIKDSDCNAAWRLAKMLHDAKPKAESVVIKTKCWDETRGNKRDIGKQKDTVGRVGDS